jgi:hypothetical protein
MDNLPLHMRISVLTPTNDDVDARRAAINELSATWSKISNVPQILNKAGAIADSLGAEGEPYADLGMEIQEAVQPHASAFLYEESPLDVGVCAGMAALSILAPEPGGHGWTTADVYSNALWSALSFQPTLAAEKREKLRREVLTSAQNRSRASARQARERSVVPDAGDLAVTVPPEGKVTTTFKKAIAATIEALRSNAALDREELDFLWWVQLDRSRLLNRSARSIPEPLRLVSLGIEAAGHLRRLPADIHQDIVCRSVEEDGELDLNELIESIGDDRLKLAESFNVSRAAGHNEVFPLLNALATGETDVPGADQKRSASTWGGRALLEAGLSRMCDTGVVKL